MTKTKENSLKNLTDPILLGKERERGGERGGRGGKTKI